MRNAVFFPSFFFYSIFFIAQFLCQVSLLFIMSGVFCTANCFASVLQCLNMCLNIMLENETDFEFVFGHFLLLKKKKFTDKTNPITRGPGYRSRGNIDRHTPLLSLRIASYYPPQYQQYLYESFIDRQRAWTSIGATMFIR